MYSRPDLTRYCLTCSFPKYEPNNPGQPCGTHKLFICPSAWYHMFLCLSCGNVYMRIHGKETIHHGSCILYRLYIQTSTCVYITVCVNLVPIRSTASVHYTSPTLYKPHTVQVPHCISTLLYKSLTVQAPHCTSPTLYKPHTLQVPHCTNPTVQTPHSTNEYCICDVFPFQRVLRDLLELCYDSRSKKKSSKSMWHPVFRWFHQKSDRR